MVCVDDVDEDAWSWLFCVWLYVDVSLFDNGFGAKGGSAIAGALHHLSSLTILEYVGSEGGV